MSRPLPRWLGYTDAPCFLYFDPDWTPRVVTLSYRSPLSWPIVGSTPDLAYTLKPFQRRLATGEPGPSLPRRRNWGHGLLAVGLYLVLLPVLFAFLNEKAGLLLSRAAAPAARETAVETPAATGQTTYKGKVLDYRITLEDSWKKLPDQPNRDLAFTLGDKVLLQVRIDPKIEDISGLRETYAKNVSKQPGVRIALSENQQVVVDGKNWSALTSKIERPDGVVREWLRAYAGNEGTFIVTATFFKSDDTAERTVAEALASFVLPKGRELITLPDGRTTYTGRATAYRITLDHAWIQRPEGENDDLHFVIGDKENLHIITGAGQEDLSKFPVQYSEGLSKRAKAEVKLLRNRPIQVRGKEWADLLFEVKMANRTLHHQVRTYSGPEGSYMLLLMSPADNEELHDLATQALDSFELPNRPADPKAGK